MKVGISASSDKGWKAEVDSRFGRAPFFAIVDLDKMEIDIKENPATGSSHGAGVKAAQVMFDQGVEAVIAGNIGPKAFQGLQSGELKLYSFKNGNIKEAVEAFKKGTINELKESTTSSHSGI